MEHSGKILSSHRFHRRFTLTPDGRYTTVTELTEWARGPYDNLCKNLLLHWEHTGSNGTSNGNADGQNGNTRTTRTAPRVVLLAPARHGDGTTTTAVLLGASLATTHRCLLLDLNFRWPGIARALGISSTPGLAALLRDPTGTDVERAIFPTAVSNLFALPNTVDGYQRTLPQIDAVRAVVSRLRSRFDYLIVDAAPVLEYPDTALLASIADTVLLIVAADSTPVEASLAARREIERGGTQVLGTVLTRQRRFVPDAVARWLTASEQH